MRPKRKMPHIALETTIYSNACRNRWRAEKKTLPNRISNTKNKERKKKNVCCFLNFYGRSISTVIILVKNINFYECERLVLCFDHAIIWLHSAIQHVSSVPNKCRRGKQQHTKKPSIVQWLWRFFFFFFVLFTQFSSFSVRSKVATYSEFLSASVDSAIEN